MMIRKKLYALSFLSFLLILLILQYLPRVISLTETNNDPVNDVYYFPHNSIIPTGKGDYKDGIDIIKLDLDGQYVNVTFEGSLEALSVADEWLDCSIFLFETYDPLISNYDQRQYSVTYKSVPPDSPDYDVYFIYYESNGGYANKYWDGDSFEYNAYDGISIGNVTGNLLTAEIPPLAFTVLDNVTYYVMAQWGNFMDPKYTSWHADYCPDAFTDYLETFDGDGGDEAIPGYDMFILIGAIIGISIILLKKRSK